MTRLILKKCIPGCERLEKVSPTEMTASVVVKVGPVKANFSGKVMLSDIDPPNGYRISGEGSGGVAGFAKGGATVKLTPDGPDATNLHYTVDAQIGGKLAQLGAPDRCDGEEARRANSLRPSPCSGWPGAGRRTAARTLPPAPEPTPGAGSRAWFCSEAPFGLAAPSRPEKIAQAIWSSMRLHRRPQTGAPNLLPARG